MVVVDRFLRGWSCRGGLGGGFGVVGFESDGLDICVIFHGRLRGVDVVGGGHCFGFAFGGDCAKEDGSSRRVMRGTTNAVCAREGRYLREWLCLVRVLVSKKNHWEFWIIFCTNATQLQESFSKRSRLNAERYESPALDISFFIATYFV